MASIINKIVKTIRCSQSFLIIAHDNPDGDSIGSELALALALKKLGKDVRILLRQPVSARYSFLPGPGKLAAKPGPFTNRPDVLFVLDTANWNQIERFGPEDFKKQTVVNIDHHIDNRKFGDINWVDPGASAVGEQIYNLLKRLPVPLTTDIAVCLYTAILTDTGGFQYMNTTATTHTIASRLLKCGVRPRLISEQVYENIRLSKLKLLHLALKTLRLRNRIIWFWITGKMLAQSGAGRKDTEGFIDYLKAVNGIKVAIIFKESTKPGEVRVTFRSKNPDILVNKIAGHFGGGGHQAAAGCTVRGSRKEVEQRVIKAVKQELK